MSTISLFLQKDDDLAMWQEFTKHYSFQKNFEAVVSDKDEYVARHERVCRYCGLAGNQAKWDDAHIVPDCLGKHNRIAMDECKACNQKFSKYETALSSFLGIARTLNQVKGKNKVPKYKSRDQSIVARPTEFGKKSVVKVSKEGTGVDSVAVNVEEKRITINYTKESYIPLDVAKAFTKIGFALLPQEEVVNYSFTKEFLLSDKNNPATSNSFYLRGYSIPFNSGVPHPIVWIFKKKKLEANIPTHMCAFWWQNYLFQFYIPLHSNDLKIITKQDFVIPKLPMIFFQQTNGSLPVNPFLYDLSSNFRNLDGEKVSIHLNIENSTGITNEALQELKDSVNQGHFELFLESVSRKKTEEERG